MSIQWNMSNGDQRSDKPVLEQLWYTWSAIGLGPLSAGFRIRAASRGLSDAGSPRVQALDRYLRYILPAGTDPFAITPDITPICLSLIQTEQGERLLANKTYTGKDGVGRPGAFFVHLLTGLPANFSAKDAIALWRSRFWHSSDIDPNTGIQLHGVQLNPIQLDELEQCLSREIDILHPGSTDSSWVNDYFPLVIRAYLMWRKRWEQWRQAQQTSMPQSQALPQLEPPRLYIAAPSDMVAAFISGITRCLPPQLLTDLTFSTYEYDVRSKGQVLLVGTAWAPSTDGKTNTNQDLPAACYQAGVAINCYNYDETKTQLEHDPLAISFAAYATQCLLTDNFLELDWLFSEKTVQHPNLNVSRFLQTYDSYIVKAQNPTQKDVEFYLDDADADMLSRVHVQDLIMRIALHDSQWLNNFLKPRLVSLIAQSKANLKLARALAQLAKAASQKAAEAVNADDETTFNAMLSIVLQTADNQSEAWRMQPRIFVAQPTIHSFLTKHPHTHFQLLELWNQLSPPLGIEEIRPFLDVPERNFEAFYSRNLRPEWKYIATEALITSAIAQEAVPLLGQKYQRPVEALMQHLSQDSWPKAIALFEQLAERNYSDKIRLLSILLDAYTNLEAEALLKKAHLKSDEYERFLIQYGPQYLLSAQKEAFVLEVFKAFAKKFPIRKMPILDNWLKSQLLSNWFEAPSTGPGNLEKILRVASLEPGESNSFIERYGKYYLERYSQQLPAHHPPSLIVDYLKHYLNSLTPNKLWKPSSPAREFILLLGNSRLLQSLAGIRYEVQQWYNVSTFLQRPSAKRTHVSALGTILQRLERDQELIERLAEAFASCIESATELASVTYMMSTLITEAELLQMLYAMAEFIRDDMLSPDHTVRLRAEVLLESYVQFALCFDSVYDLSFEKIAIGTEEVQSAMKEMLFLRTFLYILLQNAHTDIIDWLDERANPSHRQYWQKWAVYRSPGNRTPTPAFLNNPIASTQPAQLIQPRGHSYNNLAAFLAHPSTSRKEVEALGNMLSARYSGRISQLLESLAEALVSCVESETELTSVTQTLTLRKSIKRSDLLQMLYAMAELIRDRVTNSETKRVPNLLEPYVRFILCLESVCDFSSNEYTLFVRTFLNFLLQSTDEDVLQELNARARNWPGKMLRGWQAYMPQHIHSSKLPSTNLQSGLRNSPSTTFELSADGFFTDATAHSMQREIPSTGGTSSSPNWFTRLRDWLRRYSTTIEAYTSPKAGKDDKQS